MYSFSVNIRVRYAETDQMGFVYYGNYATYYEVARVESLRNLGLTYKELEADGILMPVLENYGKFYAPARYDELLKITVTVPEMPGTRVRFNYDIHSPEGQLIHQGYTILVFVGTNGRPVKAPDKINSVLQPYFEV